MLFRSDVPDSNLVAEEKLFFFWDAAWDWFSSNRSQDLPETVLGMPIIKIPFPGFHGREGAED